jgi:hypothetical protein
LACSSWSLCIASRSSSIMGPLSCHEWKQASKAKSPCIISTLMTSVSPHCICPCGRQHWLKAWVQHVLSCLHGRDNSNASIPHCPCNWIP